jgi:hypothetical protein
MHTLELYTRNDEDLPVSVVTVETSRNLDARFGHAYVCVSPESEIFNIPNGTNPRALNKESKKVKAIRKTLEESPGFAVYNGGICVVIDDNSFLYDLNTKTVTFSCTEPGSGHYDGQHTIEAILQGAENATEQQVSVTFVENQFFANNDQIRTAAETWNSRETQKLNSVQNQRGLFDRLKEYLEPSIRNNIGWRENERSIVSSALIKKECRIDRVISLIYVGVPSLRSDVLDTGDEMHNILRKGYRSTMILEDPVKAHDFEKLFVHANRILRLNDYIQKNLRAAYTKNANIGESFDQLQIVRKAGKSDMNKSVDKRKFFAQQTFEGSTVNGALLPDYIQPVMYGFLKNVLKLDRKSGEVIVAHGFTDSDLEAIWDEAGYAILTMLESRFSQYFRGRFNSRHAEFGCWSNLWDKCEYIFEEVIDNGLWRTTSAAAK